MMFLTDELSAGLITLIVFLSVIIIAVIVVFARCIVVVPQAHALIVQRLGKYHSTLEAGFHVLMPIVDSKAKMVSLKETVADFKPQPVITKDNVTMQIDAVIYYQITDPKSYVYGVTNPLKALDTLNTTTLRNIIGSLDLDQSLTSRNVINEQMREILDEATDPWGIKVFRVEVKNIMPPHDIREAMEKQMRAERERREVILLAEGEKKAAILKAEGIKESEILKAEAEKEAAILRAEAKKESTIKEAEGEAEAIVKINEATAKGLEMVKNVNVDKGVLTLKAYESLEKVANGQATKIIIPSEIQGLAGLAMSASEIVKEK